MESTPVWVTLLTALTSGLAVFALSWIKEAAAGKSEQQRAELQRQRSAVAAFLSSYNTVRAGQLSDVHGILRGFRTRRARISELERSAVRAVSAFYAAHAAMELEVTQPDVARQVRLVRHLMEKELGSAQGMSDPVHATAAFASLMVNAKLMAAVDELVSSAKGHLH